MIPSGADTVLVRHSELGTKSQGVQRRMERRLADNLHTRLEREGIAVGVSLERGRIFLEVEPADIRAATEGVSQTMGVLSASPARTVDASLAAIENELASIAEEVYTGGSFAIRARRAGPPERHDFSSADIEERGGAAVWEAVDEHFEPSVDLEDPDVTFYVECRAERAYLFLEKYAGPAGFPLGTQGRTVALVSGGIDSPVAAWEMMRRGCELAPLYFDFEAYGGPDHVARAVESVEQIAAYVPAGELHLHVAPIGTAADQLLESVTSTRMLSLRRLMFAVGEALAQKQGAHSLTTGESIGQKSSQTGANLAATSVEVTLPIHRPLLDKDKQTIIDQARHLGTYRAATIPAGCNRIAPDKPATNAAVEEVRRAEPPGLLEMADEIVDDIEVIDIEVSEPSPPGQMEVEP